MNGGLGIYIHVPFCNRTCWYCDFYSVAPNGKMMQDYVDAICDELIFYQNTGKVVESIYFGGGTPNLLDFRQIAKIIRALSETFEVSCDAEITVEMNPELVSEEMAYDLLMVGVNRASVGVQSFSDADLKFLKRRHLARVARDSVGIVAKQGFPDVSIDLILGLPSQTREQFERTAASARELGVSHISGYLLKVGDKAKFDYSETVELLPEEDEVCDNYENFVSVMNVHGFKQYEISNFAANGRKSVHNLKYWRCEEYIGLGVAAHSYLGGVRYHIIKDVDAYIHNIKGASQYLKELKGMLPPYLEGGKLKKEGSQKLYHIDDCDPFVEYVMLGLRLTAGLDIRKLAEIDGGKCRKFLSALGKRKWFSDFVVRDGDKVHLTLRGFLVSNRVIAELLS